MFILFQKIGQYGPLILLIITIILLRNKYNLLFYYILFLFVNFFLNLFLKGILQCPRPSIDKQNFDLMIKNKERFMYKHGIPYDIYGMPSGHSQSVILSTIFIYSALHDVKITMLYLVVSLITISERVIDNHHTCSQVIVGSVVGLILGYIAFNMAVKNMEGKKTAKKDDFGPI